MTSKPQSLNEKHQLEWECCVLASLEKLIPQIINQLKQLNLSHTHSINDVQSNTYVLVKDMIDKGSLCYASSKWYYKEAEIKSFTAWLRTVIFNDLRKLRIDRNKIECAINLDDCYYPHDKDNPFKYLENNELREKIKAVCSPIQARILELHFISNVSYKEIVVILESENLGTHKETSLRKQNQRAIEKLRSLY